ncbi:unnamed protein product [Leuciscus chuanchicus]
MGKTADHNAIIDTLKQEGKTQKEISERIGCSQSAVSRHLSGKSVGRKKCGKKRCTTRRGDRTMRKIVEKDRFQTLGDLRKQWTESGVETSRATVHRRVQEMGYRCRIPQVKPLLNQKQRQKRLNWATEKQHWTVAQWLLKFCMSFGNQGARVWRKTGEKEMPKCLKSSVKYPQSVMVWGAMSAAGVGPLFFIKGRVNAASYQEILEHSMLPSAEKLYGDEDFILQHDLAPAHRAKTTGKWFTAHGITVLNWPANSSDLNPIENLWDIVKRKLRDARPNTLDELKAAIEASWASITPQQCHRLIASMPRRIEAVISAKRIPDQVTAAPCSSPLQNRNPVRTNEQPGVLECAVTRRDQTDGEVQCGSGDVGEVKEYVREFTRDYSLLMLIRFSYTQAHYGLDHIGHADNVKNETSLHMVSDLDPTTKPNDIIVLTPHHPTLDLIELSLPHVRPFPVGFAPGSWFDVFLCHHGCLSARSQTPKPQDLTHLYDLLTTPRLQLQTHWKLSRLHHNEVSWYDLQLSVC